MVLKPEKMARIRIIGANTRKQEVISALHDVGVMQLEQVSGDVAQLLETGKPGESYQTLTSLLQKFRGFESQLPHRLVSEKKYFNSIEELLNAAASIRIESDLKMLKEEEADLLTEINGIKARMVSVELLKHLDYDLSIFNNRFVSSFLVQKKEKLDIGSRITENIENSSVVDLGNDYLIASVPKNRDTEIAHIASNNGFTLIHIPEMSGKPSAYYDYLKGRLDQNEKSLDITRKNLANLSENYFEQIVQIREQLEIEVKKLEVSEKLASTRDTFAIEGWIPERYYTTLEELLKSISGETVIFGKVETKELAPTMMSNPRRFKLFEFFVRFYSLPMESEFDPTLIFALAFPIFFGFMVGDWGYGLVIMLMSMWVIRRLDHPPKKSRIPKSLSRFVLMIMGPGPLKTLAKALIPGAIVAMAVGLLFNNFFGFPLLPYTVFEVTTGFGGITIFGFPPSTTSLFDVSVVIPKLLLISGYIGVAMVSLGLVLGVANELSHGHKRGAAGKIGWLMLAWGIVIFGLNLIHHTVSLNPAQSISTPVALGLIIAGLATILASEGSQGAMEIPSIISHILSYTRIVGILLASVILAQVIDLIFLRGVSKSPLFAVIGILILVLGQIFNLVIAVFEPGIQGARLIYVEFFSKFFKGNGKYFRPFSTPRNYTIRQFELEPIKKK